MPASSHDDRRGQGYSSAVDDTPLIVVAEDDDDIRELLAMRLASRGFEVATATDGRAALELVRTRRPVAAVLDWMMPVVQGHEVCRMLKEDASTAEIPIVLLTARAMEGDVHRAFELGADEYITKPFDFEELVQTLRRLLAGGVSGPAAHS